MADQLTDDEMIDQCARLALLANTAVRDLNDRIRSRHRQGVASPLDIGKMMPLFDAVNSLRSSTEKMRNNALRSNGIDVRHQIPGKR